jgi:hypothetical protein
LPVRAVFAARSRRPSAERNYISNSFSAYGHILPIKNKNLGCGHSRFGGLYKLNMERGARREKLARFCLSRPYQTRIVAFCSYKHSLNPVFSTVRRGVLSFARFIGGSLQN